MLKNPLGSLKGVKLNLKMASTIEFFVKMNGGYNKCIIYKNGPRNTLMKGCCGMEMIITMSNGWKIATNDLWYDKFYTELDPNVLIGTVSLNYNKEISDESFIYP